MASQSTNAKMSQLIGVDFEIYGKVQGVFFRMYTQKQANDLGLKGWCMNTPEGTVVGHIEGPKKKVEDMKDWLRYTGSPESSIDKAEFRNEQKISRTTLINFEIKK